jgi:hypothetical protein
MCEVNNCAETDLLTKVIQNENTQISGSIYDPSSLKEKITPSDIARLVSVCSKCLNKRVYKNVCWICRRTMTGLGFPLSTNESVCGLCIPLKSIWEKWPEVEYDDFLIRVEEFDLEPEFLKIGRRMSIEFCKKSTGRIDFPRLEHDSVNF